MERYNDSLIIRQCKTAFDLDSETERFDLRNIKYASNTDHLNCPICQQPFLYPMTTMCGHTFCKECINECLKLGPTSDDNSIVFCPLDRTQIDVNDIHNLFPTPLIIANMVDELMVYCMNHERGCEWKGHRWEVENHVINVCGYTGVFCNGKRTIEDSKSSEETLDEAQENENNLKKDITTRCKILVERRFVDLNNEECVHRVFDCSLCGNEITKITEARHLEEDCELNYSTCDLCQNDMIPLKNLAKHRENCKKSGRLQCPAHEIGCEWSGNNEPSLEIHLQKGNCLFNQLLPHFTSLKTRIADVESENKYLQREIHHILDSVIQGKITNLGYSEPLEEIGTFRRALSKLQDQDRLLHLDYEIERLRYELDERINPFMERETNNISEHQNLITGLVNDNFMIKDEMNLQRALVNSLRKQVQFFSFRNRQQQRAGTPLMQSFDLDELTSNILSRSSSEERLNLKL